MKEFKDKFRIGELLVAKVGGWNISLRPEQVTIGSLVLSLDRHCLLMSDLKPKEIKELGDAFKVIERLLQVTFKPNRINYLALMMVDAQVHFHVLPRYENPVNFLNKEYKDISWPKPPRVLESLKLSKEEVRNLWAYMKENI